MDNRHVRNRDYILTNRSEFRPVVGIGEKPAKPLAVPLTYEQRKARDRLTAALDEAETLSGR